MLGARRREEHDVWHPVDLDRTGDRIDDAILMGAEIGLRERSGHEQIRAPSATQRLDERIGVAEVGDGYLGALRLPRFTLRRLSRDHPDGALVIEQTLRDRFSGMPRRASDNEHAHLPCRWLRSEEHTSELQS